MIRLWHQPLDNNIAGLNYLTLSLAINERLLFKEYCLNKTTTIPSKIFNGMQIKIAIYNFKIVSTNFFLKNISKYTIKPKRNAILWSKIQEKKTIAKEISNRVLAWAIILEEFLKSFVAFFFFKLNISYWLISCIIALEFF